MADRSYSTAAAAQTTNLARTLQPGYVRLNVLYSQQDNSGGGGGGGSSISKSGIVSSGTKHQELSFQNMVPKGLGGPHTHIHSMTPGALDTEMSATATTTTAVTASMIGDHGGSPLGRTRDRLSSSESMQQQQQSQVNNNIGEVNFQTVVRIRPSVKGSTTNANMAPNSTKLVDDGATGSGQTQKIISMDEDMKTLVVNRNIGTPLADRYPSYQFTFDRVFDEYTNQKIFYQSTCRPLVRGLFSGHNSTIFAYGQTRSGKRYTFEGVVESERRGIIPRVIEDLFATLRTLGQSMNAPKFNVKVSYIQVYNETVSDLLNPNTHNLKIIDDKSKTSSHISGAKHIILKDPSDIYNILKMGRNNRSIPSGVKLNDLVARSHTILSVMLEQVGMNAGNLLKTKLNFVTLAGSEKASSGSNSSSKSDDGSKIAMTFNALATVVAFLSRNGSRHIPYRDSKLTHILKDSINNNALCLFIATIFPVQDNYNETLACLKYASRIRQSSNLITGASPTALGTDAVQDKYDASEDTGNMMTAEKPTGVTVQNIVARKVDGRRSTSAPLNPAFSDEMDANMHHYAETSRPIIQHNTSSNYLQSPPVQQHQQPQQSNTRPLLIRPQQLHFSPTKSDILFDEYTRSTGEDEELQRVLLSSVDQSGTGTTVESDNLKETINGMKAELTEINNQKEEYKSQTEKLNQIVKKLAQERLLFKQSSEETTTENEKLRREIGELTEKVETLTRSTNASLSSKDEFMTSLNREKNELRSELFTMSNKLASAELENRKLRTNIEELTISNEELAEKRDQLEKIISVKSSELIELQKTLDEWRLNSPESSPLNKKSPIRLLSTPPSSPSIAVTYSHFADAQVNTDISSVRSAISVNEVREVVQRSKELEDLVESLEIKIESISTEKHKLLFDLQGCEKRLQAALHEIAQVQDEAKDKELLQRQRESTSKRELEKARQHSLEFENKVESLNFEKERLIQEKRQVLYDLEKCEQRLSAANNFMERREVKDMIQRSNELEQSVKSLESKLRESNESKQRLMRELQTSEQKVLATIVDKEEFEQRARDLEKELEACKSKIVQLSAEKQKVLVDLQVNEQHMLTASTEIELLKNKIKTAELKIESRVDARKFDEVVKHSRELETTVESLESKIVLMSAEKQRIQYDLQVAQQRLTSTQKETEELTDKLRVKTSEIKRLKQNVSDLTLQIEDVTLQKNDIQSRMEMMEQEKGNSEQQYEKAVRSYESNIQALTTSMQKLIQELRNSNIEIEKLKDLMPDRDMEEDNASLLHSLSLLGAYVTQLKKENEDLQTTVNLSTLNIDEDEPVLLPEHVEKIQELTTRLESTLDALEASNEEVQRLNDLVATLNKVEDDRIALQSSLSDMSAKLSSAREERDDLKSKVSVLESNFTSKVDEYEERIRMYGTDMHVLNTNIENAIVVINGLKQQILKLDGELHLSNQSCEAQGELITQLEADIKELGSEVEVLRNEGRIKDTTLLEKRSELENLKEELTSNCNRVKQLESDRTILNNQIKSLKSQLESYAEEKEQTRIQLNRLKSEIEELEKQLAQSEESKEQLKREVKDMRTQMNEAETRAVDIFNERKRVLLQLDDAHTELHSLSEECQEQKSKIVQLELVLLERNCDIDRLRQALTAVSSM